LMVTAYPNRTSPVLRGAYILENITGTPPAPPPPNVDAFKENKEGEKPKTIRAIMEAHRANPTCNACHGIMDPLGFALENFDAIGTWRDVAAILGALAFIVFLFWHLNLHYMNLVFAAMGYRVFTVLPPADGNPLSGRTSQVLITRRIAVPAGERLVAYRLSDTVYFEVDE